MYVPALKPIVDPTSNEVSKNQNDEIPPCTREFLRITMVPTLFQSSLVKLALNFDAKFRPQKLDPQSSPHIPTIRRVTSSNVQHDPWRYSRVQEPLLTIASTILSQTYGRLVITVHLRSGLKEGRGQPARLLVTYACFRPSHSGGFNLAL
ncbi:hypothetical protein BDN72DRAFT_862120 [Pluteus cervinus]|uniref:Uncharacterized protein n=1 Tax=Pluteus cervinus TaxID=181527 RepID=A0ACD3ACK3_9AGAR|nr:hypothetical protein BDN72DRAFT_862120 [Pluteus cervinus]